MTYASPGIRSPMHMLLKWFLSTFLSVHGKRVFFVTTVFFEVSNYKEVTKDVLRKVNAVLQVAENADALAFPAQLHSVIWGGETLEQTLAVFCNDEQVCVAVDAERLREACESVVDMTPIWLQYARREDMVSDILRVVDATRNLHAA